MKYEGNEVNGGWLIFYFWLVQVDKHNKVENSKYIILLRQSFK